MIISELDYLNTIVAAPSVVGGYKYGIIDSYSDFFELPEAEPAPQFSDVFQYDDQLTDGTISVTVSVLLASGQTNDNRLFSLSSVTASATASK